MSWMWGGGVRVTGHLDLAADTHANDEEIKMIGNAQYSSGVGFGTKHDGFWLAAMCDGAVYKVNVELERETLYQLAAANDGGVPMDFQAD